MKRYCVQNNGRCETCSLVNYGLDCANNPIETKPVKRLRGWDAAMASYDGHHGPVTVKAVLAQIPQELKERLTGHELGLVMSAVNAAYHNGRSSMGAEVCDGSFVWVNPLNRGFDLDQLRGLPIAD